MLIKKELLEMLNGKSFRTSTKWVEKNDQEVYECLHDMMTEFVQDETNATDEKDLEAFENGDWVVEYTFNGHDEEEEIEIIITVGRNGQHIANQAAWIQETISMDEFMDCWNWKMYEYILKRKIRRG